MNTRNIFVSAVAVLAVLAACDDDVRKKKKDSPSYCEAYCDCVQCDDTAEQECEAQVDAGQQQAQASGCADEYAALEECSTENGECVSGQYDTATGCAAETQAYLSCFGGGTCTTVGDGVCDEPEGTGTCDEGTDAIDCSTCATTNDGTCDEPEGSNTCPEGTDVFDCNSSGCPWTNNGVCDEPEGSGACPEGTDVADCSTPTCNYTNNGQCDEPEGTGLCPEGTDVFDCSQPQCDSEASCDLCQECAFMGECADEATTCQNSADCSGLLTCINNCDTTCANDPDPNTCFDTCINGTGGCAETYPNGIADFNAMVDCVFTQECPNACM